MKENDNNNAPNNILDNKRIVLKNQNNYEENKNNNKNEIIEEAHNDGKKNDNEKEPLKKNEKLIKIVSNLYHKLNAKENENKDLEDIYKDYYIDKNEKKFKKNISNVRIIVMLIIGAIHLIINLIGIFTIKSIMDTLFDFFFDSLKYFLYKTSDLEKFNLTDFKSLYLSPYNFYTNYFEHISNNKVEFDLMMFWDFIGLIFYKYCGYKFTYISSFIFSSIFIIFFILQFDFLNIDEKTHKYSFFQLLYLFLVYIFLWVFTSSLALLSYQIYIQRLLLFFKKKAEDNIKRGLNQTNKENNDPANELTILKKKLDKTLSKEEIKDIKNEIGDERNEIVFNPILISIIFLAFLTNHIINRKIYKFKSDYITEILLKDKNDAYNKMYSKEKNIFLFWICFPYIAEMIISLLIYFIYDCIFISSQNLKEKKEIKGETEEKAQIKGLKNENQINEEIKIKEVTIKKICGYTIFNQTIIPKEDSYQIESPGLTRNYCKKGIKYLQLFLISIKDCLFNSIFYCCAKSCDCCSCRYNCYCCSCCNCCCYDEELFQLDEFDLCLCYKEKRTLKWLYDSITTRFHRHLVFIILAMLYCQLFVIGFDVIYEEKNEDNKKIDQKQNNIIFPLIISFIISLAIFLFISVLYYREVFDKLIKKIIKQESEDEKKNILMSFTCFAFMLIEFFISVSSCIFSIMYIYDKKLLSKGKLIYYPLFLNKFMIFFLYSFIAKNDEKNEIFSNSSFVAIYLFISELLIYVIKIILSIKALIIIQIVSSLCVVFLLLILLPKLVISALKEL